MRAELPYVSFFNDPFQAMLYQRKWAFNNWIVREGLEAERFKNIVEHMDKEIEKYIQENGCPRFAFQDIKSINTGKDMLAKEEITHISQKTFYTFNSVCRCKVEISGYDIN